MKEISRHLIDSSSTVRKALKKLDILASDAVLFLVDDNLRLVGSLTDGDIRRGLIQGKTLEDPIESFIQEKPTFLKNKEFDISQLKHWRDNNFKIIPVLDNDNRVIDIINFRNQRSYLPIDAVIMAGGEGQRLRPLTKNIPKPLLKVGEKPIIEHNTDRLASFGIKNITLTIKYLGEQLIEHYKDGENRGIKVNYITEDEPLGTIGSVAQIECFESDYILVMNSDLLTNVDFEDMFSEFIKQDADMIVATVPYEVEIPYGVIETEGDRIVNLKEKPTYTYYSNAGIYMFKREHVNLIPPNAYFNATDLMEQLYSNEGSVINFPILGYWLDIGKHKDFKKAQKDIEHIKL